MQVRNDTQVESRFTVGIYHQYTIRPVKIIRPADAEVCAVETQQEAKVNGLLVVLLKVVHFQALRLNRTGRQ
jgi:hypothetical protein